MDKQRLINAGYREFKDPLNNSDYGMQKRFRDEKGTKYFINVYAYSHNGVESFQPEIQYSEGKNPTMNVTLFSEDLNVIEGMFEALWNFLDKPYYEFD